MPFSLSTLRRGQTSWAISALVLAAWQPLPALATLVDTRAAMGGTDFIDWGQLPFSGASVLVPSANLVSDDGLTATVSVPNTFWHTTQGPFPANYTPGDDVIASGFGSASNTATMLFASPQAGVGAQFANTVQYGSFTAQLQVFDSLGVLLESQTRDGVTNGAADGSAIFLGILRPQNDIARAEFSVLPYNLPGVGSFTRFAINRVELTTTPIPEPTTTLLLLLGLPVLAWRLGQRGRSGGTAGSVL